MKFLKLLAVTLTVGQLACSDTTQDISRENTLARVKRAVRPPSPKDRSLSRKNAEVLHLFQTRQSTWCQPITTLMKKKTIAMKKIGRAIEQMKKNVAADLHPAERELHVTRFHIINQELNETEDMILSSFKWLQDTLGGDYKDIINIKDGARKRLKKLRDATLKEEQEYKTLLKTEVIISANLCSFLS